MNHRKPYSVFIIACALLLSGARASEEQTQNATMDDLERQLELHDHSELLARMAAPGSTLTPFTTDGCSGGLSVGWEYLAGHVENVRDVHGTRPPWETCCIAHDRLYHVGAVINASAEESFVARKQADLALLSCVVETGKTRQEELMVKYDVSAGTVETLYAAIAELMYRAVRIGGIPCSTLPWRWGFGWPECG